VRDEVGKNTLAAFGASDYRHRCIEPGPRLVGGSRMKSNRLYRCLLHLVVLLLGATNVAAESPTVHIEYQASVDETGGLRYVLAEGTMSGTVRGAATYTVPVQIHYPAEGGNGTVVLELTNSALLFFHLRDRGDRVGDRRSDADDIDELEAMQVNFGWAGAREYLLRNGFTHMAIQYSKAVTDFMGASPPEGRTRRRLCYGRIERATDGYEIVRDAARWLAATGALTGDAPPVPPHEHVIAYGLSGTGYFLRDYLIRGENARDEIDGFFLHAAGSKCLALIDDSEDCPEGSMCVGSPRFSHFFTCPGPPPTNGAKVLAVDAQSDLEFNAGALAREGAVDDPDYVRWEVAGAPHVPVFAMDLTRLGAPHQNPMDWSPIWRSAFHYLDRWVKHGTAPPTAPPIEGRMHATEDGDIWKCDVDADGNALGGIRLPPIEAPMGVYTGFDSSWLNPAVSQGHRYAIIFAYGGRFERFGDETLAERYPTEADYKKAFEAAARRAFEAGYILEEDLLRYTAAPPRDQFFDSAGVRIRYIDVGPRDAEPIVLVHGAAQSIEAAWGMTGVIDALDDDHRVIALDLRGHGKSDKPHDPRQYGNAFVEDIIQLLDHLTIEEAHVVGYSMGGRIVCKLVADHPDRAISAMPSGTNVEPPEPGGEDEFVERLARSLEESGSIRPAIEHFTADGSMTAEQVDEIVATIRATNDTIALAAVIRSLDELLPDRAKLEANPVPCLSIVGAGDPNLPITRTTAEYMANLKIHVIEGTNHLTAFRHPAFVAAIKSFAAEHATAEGQ
jgi:pimeloyl-ACP methyl ester carboxylesterase